MTTSLIVSTYNRPEALNLCLLSIFRQSRLPDEIIVGDDGSTGDTRKLISRLQKISPVPLIHVWHEDNGFRLAMMRNKSVAAAKGEYIIEIDGDLILHRNFIDDHVKFSRRGCFLKGGRCNLGLELTTKVCSDGNLIPLHWFTPGIESKRTNAWHLPVIGRLLSPHYRPKGIALGCNMSYYRDDFIAINGYDEYFEGWGGEDGDFARRLKLLGLEKRHLKFVGLTFHLWHEDKYMYNQQKNVDYSRRPNPEIRCRDGVDKYLNE